MPEPAQHISVNLLSKDPFSQSSVGKVLMWALSVGRYIVVFTELIVILSFLSRFKLDRDLTDLNEQIARQQSIILSYGDLEDNVRDLQAKLAHIKEKEAQAAVIDSMPLLTSITPEGIKYSTLTLDASRISIEAQAASALNFAQFLYQVNSRPEFGRISLQEVNSGGSEIEFQLSLEKRERSPKKKVSAKDDLQNTTQ